MDKDIPFKSILDQTNDVVIITEIEPLDEPFGPKILYVNRAFTKLTGYTQEEVLGKTPRILQGDKTDKNVLKSIRDALEKKEAIHAELLNYAKDQTEYWFDFTIVPITDRQGDIKYFAAIERDITARKKKEDAQAVLSTLVEFSDEAIIGKDLDGTIRSWNKAAAALYGYTEKEAIGTSIKRLFPKDRQEEFNHIIHKITEDQHIKNFETLRVHKTGYIIPVSITIAPVKNTYGEVIGASTIARDITQQKLIEEKLKHLAEHDALTGLINRPLFDDRLEHAMLLSKRQKHSLAVCFVDIDDFKQINDIYGHAMGDLLLCATTKRLQTCIRDSDTLARFGGDEFGLILLNVSEEKVVTIARKILRCFSKKFLIKDEAFQVSLSIGISLYPRDGNTLLVEKADAAMYHIKKRGKNNFKLFDAHVKSRI
ncbi:MAG: diguanylate cyclase [Legionellaceae bacterium]|nr:diguanylate cyclase [Legionellaceae bacterium]